MAWPLYDVLSGKSNLTPNQTLDLFLNYVSSKNLSLYAAQEEAILEIYSGRNVILNTPTGSGKSLVATALHFSSISQKKRSIYTCPIKALVNEKFLALCREFGPEQVGMITGDATVNSGAPIICCTAEILSNEALRFGQSTPYQDIIMDEFHYYSDRDRGVAWQIPLLSLKRSRFLLMSATLGSTEFFEKSLTSLNALPTTTIKSNERPVPLSFEYSESPLHLKINELVNKGRSPIYLVNFTQRECAEQAQNLLSTDFCTKDEKKLIGLELEGVSFKSPYGKEIQKLIKHGVGLHHAGLLPRYRVLIEKLAQKGMLKVICGTDTLGVGVNVPIRTVLFTKLCKYDGQKTTLLSVRDFQQISGRAGRKGFDDQGSVVVQAPEHAIENLIQEQKLAADPKKSKKVQKKKPPEKGYIAWSKETLLKLSQGEPEPLVSRFQVTHAMILNILSRPETKNCQALLDLIGSSHESDLQKKQHVHHAISLFRSLYDRKIIELNPLRIHVDLQQDFSLNHTLSLYLIDTLKRLDPLSLNYPLDLLTLVESILENPDLILRRQVDRLKTIRMQELKEQGMDFEDRILELEKIEHPKPNRDFIYDTFNEFSSAHPWIGQENVRPKSVAREMFETFQSFHEYIREYNLERVEGLLLRYLSEVYKVLIQTVPEFAKNQEVESLIEYFGEMLHAIDSSLVEEWERMKSPDFISKTALLREERELKELQVAREKEAENKLKRSRQISFRNEVFRVIKMLASSDWLAAAEILCTTMAEVETPMKEYLIDHSKILLDQNARSLKHSNCIETTEQQWRIEQTLIDVEGHNDWMLTVAIDFQQLDERGKPKLTFVTLKAIA